MGKKLFRKWRKSSWRKYEDYKSIMRQDLTPEEYEKAIRAAVAWLGV